MMNLKKILLFLILLIPLKVGAAEVEITDFLVDSEVKENGDLEVRELILVDGTFNWYERDILYENASLTGSDYANNYLYNASDITDIEIKAKTVNKISFDTFKENFDSFTKTDWSYNGAKGFYTESNLNGGYRYRMYYYTENEKVAFYIKYTVKDAVVLHNDVAELYWTFVPDGFEEDLQNIKVRINLPKEDNTDNFRFWAHGNLSGEINKTSNKQIIAEIDEVNMGESVDVRLTFDKSLVNQDVVKKSDDDALEKIIEVETERADVANSLRDKLKKERTTAIVLTIGLYGLIIGLGIYLYFKYGKSPKSGYYSKYNREFIDDYNVEVIDYLMKRNITPNAMSASIMNLIYKKKIKAEEIKDAKNKTKNYIFSLENTENLNESENILVAFLFDKVGNKQVNKENKKIFTTLDLKKYAKGTQTCSTFINNYTDWKNDVIKKGKEQQFYESSGTPKIWGVIIFILCFLVFTYGSGIEIDFVPTYLLLLVGIVFLVFTFTMHKKTLKGSIHYDKWMAFKNFLNDFGAFELKELPEIILWERYLVYATIFGLADKVEKSMNVKIKEIDPAVYGYDYMPMYFYLDLGHTLNTSINSAISSAYNRQAANYQNTHSSYSSGGGFGGGFSSGGGFGGGGGGGRFG